jgi:hypothetical protein
MRQAWKMVKRAQREGRRVEEEREEGYDEGREA